MNMQVYQVAFMAGVVMVAAGTPDAKNDAGLKKRFFFGGSNVHPADMALPELMSSLREHLVALNNAIHIIDVLQDTGIDSTVQDLLNKLDGLPISTGTYPPYSTTPNPGTSSTPIYTQSSTSFSWFKRGVTGYKRYRELRQELLSELVLKKLRAIANEEQ